MNSNKKLMAVLAGCALVAATAIPAMALENEFHGMFGLRAVNANYNGGGGTGYLALTGDSKTTNNFVEQRARIFYSAKASDDLKLVTGFEIDSTWGKSSYAVGRTNEGGALGADTVNLETKWVYLDWNCPLTGANFKAGIQGLNDAYKGVFVGAGADAAGLLVSKGVGAFTGTFGFFRLDDRTIDTTKTINNASVSAAGSALTTDVTFSNGKATRDLLILDGKFNVSKDIKVGASYYFVNSDNVQQWVKQTAPNAMFGTTINAADKYDFTAHVLGLNAAATFGPASVDGFLLYEFGSVDNYATILNKTHLNSFAFNLAGKVKAGPGTAKANFLFVNGGSNAFASIDNTTSSAFSENGLGGAFGNMFLLVRNSGNTTNDQYVIYESSNKGMGLIGGSIGYDATITPKCFANVNAGFVAVAKDAGKESKYQGTEINAEVGYKLYDSLTASIQGAYVILGDFYKKSSTATGMVGTDPANPYLSRIVLNYVF